MTMKFSSSVLFFFVTLAVLIPALLANIGDFDEHWENQRELAKKAALEAYQPDPEEITQHLNAHVRRALEGTNSTRRDLKGYKGKCMAVNPIDKCWRCRADWYTDRKRLADCVIGFGRNTRGGKNGRYYIVTDSSDDDVVNPKPGTLRYGVIQKEPLWIVFGKSMIIKLKQELLVASHKTIDGRGVNVHIAYGAGITIQFVQNVIIHGLHIHDIIVTNGGLIRDSVDHYGLRTKSDGDGISIFGSTNVWIDHLSMRNCVDGLIDAIEGSTAITISNIHMTHHNEVMLLGARNANAADKIMQITVAFNHFGQGLVQRMPRCRWGFFHVVNNDYTHWIMYAIGGSQNPTIISQGNRFIAPSILAAKEVTKREYTPDAVWKQWTWRSEGDVLMNGAFFIQSGGKPSRQVSKQDMISPTPFNSGLTRFSGALSCRRGKAC